MYYVLQTMSFVNATVRMLLLCCVFATVNELAHVNLSINGDDDDDDDGCLRVRLAVYCCWRMRRVPRDASQSLAVSS